jgi:hypothetical protein
MSVVPWTRWVICSNEMRMSSRVTLVVGALSWLLALNGTASAPADDAPICDRAHPCDPDESGAFCQTGRSEPIAPR